MAFVSMATPPARGSGASPTPHRNATPNGTLTVVLLLTLSMLTVVYFVLLAHKLDNRTQITYHVLSIPAWAMYAVVACVAAMACLEPFARTNYRAPAAPHHHRHHHDSDAARRRRLVAVRLNMLSLLLLCAGAIATQLMLAQKLEFRWQISYFVAMSPLFGGVLAFSVVASLAVIISS